MRLTDADVLKQTFCAECDRTQCEDCVIDYHFEHLAPTVDAKPIQHGHWINILISASGESSAECNLCGAIVHNNFSNTINYCPNCGAKMDKETANELGK